LLNLSDNKDYDRVVEEIFNRILTLYDWDEQATHVANHMSGKKSTRIAFRIDMDIIKVDISNIQDIFAKIINNAPIGSILLDIEMDNGEAEITLEQYNQLKQIHIGETMRSYDEENDVFVTHENSEICLSYRKTNIEFDKIYLPLSDFDNHYFEIDAISVGETWGNFIEDLFSHHLIISDEIVELRKLFYKY